MLVTPVPLLVTVAARAVESAVPPLPAVIETGPLLANSVNIPLPPPTLIPEDNGAPAKVAAMEMLPAASARIFPFVLINLLSIIILPVVPVECGVAELPSHPETSVRLPVAPLEVMLALTLTCLWAARVNVVFALQFRALFTEISPLPRVEESVAMKTDPLPKAVESVVAPIPEEV